MVKADRDTSGQSSTWGAGGANHPASGHTRPFIARQISHKGTTPLPPSNSKPGKTIPDYSKVHDFYCSKSTAYDEAASTQQAQSIVNVHYRQDYRESKLGLHNPDGELVSRGCHPGSVGRKVGQESPDGATLLDCRDDLDEDGNLGVEVREEDLEECDVALARKTSDHKPKDLLLPSGATTLLETGDPSDGAFQREPLINNPRNARALNRDKPRNTQFREFSPNGRADGGTVPFHDIARKKQLDHDERYEKPQKGCNAALHLDHMTMAETEREQQRKEKAIREKYHPSIGKILFTNKFMGTCLAVGRCEKRYILTAHHVLRNIGEIRTAQFQPLEMIIGGPNLVVVFGQVSFRLQPNISHGSYELDYSIVELVPNNHCSFPPPIKDFGPSIGHLISDTKVVCIGFQDSVLKDDFKAVLYLADNTQCRCQSLNLHIEEQQDLERELSRGKSMLATALIYGCSGGLVVKINCDTQTMHAIGIILKGYPSAYYLNTPAAMLVRKTMKGCQMVEIMLPFDEIFKDVETFHRKLAPELFGNFL